MRTNIDIDDALLAEARKLSGCATKKGTIGEANDRDFALMGRHLRLAEVQPAS
jgi:Arc/MetJ family transcription regulator